MNALFFLCALFAFRGTTFCLWFLFDIQLSHSHLNRVSALVLLAVAGEVTTSLYLERRLSQETWTKIRKISTTQVQSGLVGCGVLCSGDDDCTLFLLSGPDLCHLARVEM